MDELDDEKRYQQAMMIANSEYFKEVVKEFDDHAKVILMKSDVTDDILNANVRHREVTRFINTLLSPIVDK